MFITPLDLFIVSQFNSFVNKNQKINTSFFGQKQIDYKPILNSYYTLKYLKWISSKLLIKAEYCGILFSNIHSLKSYRYRKSKYRNNLSIWNSTKAYATVVKWILQAPPIIEKETFDIVKRICDGRRRLTLMGEMPILSGMIFCADCGKNLYQVRGRCLPQKEYMVCSTYRKVSLNNQQWRRL